MTPWFLLLLRAGRLAECAVQREVQVEHAHARFAEHAELARQRDPVDQRRNLCGIDAARLRDPRRLQPRVRDRDLGIGPDADAVTASAGTGVPAAAFSCR